MRRATALCDMYYLNRMIIDAALFRRFAHEPDVMNNELLPPRHDHIAITALYTAMTTMCMQCNGIRPQPPHAAAVHMLVDQLFEFMLYLFNFYTPRRITRRRGI